MQLMSFVLIEKEDRYLLIKEASAKWCGEWFFPGGKVNKNETIGDAAIREVKEEAGCNVKVKGIFYFRYFKHLISDCLHIYFHGNTNDIQPKDFADENSLGARWFGYEEIVNLRLRQNAMEVINAYRKHKYDLPLSHFRMVKG